MTSPLIEKKAQGIFEKIRCTTCDFQSIQDSPAPMAQDMRAFIISGLEKGESEQDIISFLTQRYGDAIYLDPGFSVETFFLWSVPVLLFLGLLMWYKIFYKKTSIHKSK